MAGLYFHIPFCRKLCYYCDFHFTVSLKWKTRLVKSIVEEVKRRYHEINREEISTVYFGGGTPSLLTIDEIVIILKTIYQHFNVADDVEISFETNPDDLELKYLSDLKNYTSINRLSIGIQSFQNKHLELMNRRHTAAEAITSIERAQKYGFENLNIDLIYAVPGMTKTEWETNLLLFKKMGAPHLSAYHLTFETKTVFGFYQKKGRLTPVNENTSLEHFNILLDFTENENFDHYEISNFARGKLFSKHNLGYWSGEKYLGFGPSAHSFLGDTRRWNIANNTKYMQAIENNDTELFEQESISAETAYNEYILTAMRTMWGVKTKIVKDRFGTDHQIKFIESTRKFVQSEDILMKKNSYTLTRKGKLRADYIISELMRVN